MTKHVRPNIWDLEYAIALIQRCYSENVCVDEDGGEERHVFDGMSVSEIKNRLIRPVQDEIEKSLKKEKTP